MVSMIIKEFVLVKHFEKELRKQEQKDIQKIRKVLENMEGNRVEDLRKTRKLEQIRVFTIENLTMALFEIRIGKKSLNFRVFACTIIKIDNKPINNLCFLLLKVFLKKVNKLDQNDIATSIERCKKNREKCLKKIKENCYE